MFSGSARQGISNAIAPYFQSDIYEVSPPVFEIEGPVLTVVGSMSSISHRQIDHLLKQDKAQIDHFAVDIHELLISTVPPVALSMAQRALEEGAGESFVPELSDIVAKRHGISFSS